MPVKTVTCVICNQEVTKRSTLSLKELGAGQEGRACRAHPEVQELQTALEEKRQTQEALAKFKRQMQVMNGIQMVRVYHSLRRMPVELIYYRLEQNGYPRDVIEEIKAGVAKEGGPLMSETEIVDAIAMAAVLKQRGLAAQQVNHKVLP